MEGAMRDATERDRQRGRQRETEKAIMSIKQAFLKLNKCSLNKKSDAVQIDLG